MESIYFTSKGNGMCLLQEYGRNLSGRASSILTVRNVLCDSRACTSDVEHGEHVGDAAGDAGCRDADVAIAFPHLAEICHGGAVAGSVA